MGGQVLAGRGQLTHRSASSRMRISSSSMLTEGELRNRSIRRPGVATTTSGRERRSASCDLSDSPPTISAKRTSVNFASCRPISSHCAASSRVGVSTSTRVAAMRRWRCTRRSSAGSRKAAVLPLPVTADAQMSTPRSAAGITAVWMGVGETNPSSHTALRRGLQSLSASNVVIVTAVSGSDAPSSSSSAFAAAFAATAAAFLRSLTADCLRSRRPSPAASSARSAGAESCAALDARAASFSLSDDPIWLLFFVFRFVRALAVCHFPEVDGSTMPSVDGPPPPMTKSSSSSESSSPPGALLSSESSSMVMMRDMVPCAKWPADADAAVSVPTARSASGRSNTYCM